MKFTWTNQETQVQTVKQFLQTVGVSRKLLAKVKFQGGQILVNQVEQTVRYPLAMGDEVAIIIPEEGEHETLLPDDHPIDIVFEDQHLLVVNKPSGIASIPAQYHPRGTLANRIKHYYNEQNYADRVVHVVTRLDRDTSGLMVVAKHGFAHAQLDKQLRHKTFHKHYYALVSGDLACLEKHAEINLPIARDLDSLIKRKVSTEGKQALTEYWTEAHFNNQALVNIQLHTGRTHQIRVHFAAIGCPLLGDELYGGDMQQGITRQALHCHCVSFVHPFNGKQLVFRQSLPSDLLEVSNMLVQEALR